jgi:hypothetical protein
MNNVTVKRIGGPVTSVVVVGSALVGNHRMFLWNADATNPQPVPKDPSSDIYNLGSAAGLDQKILSWEVRVVSPSKAAGQVYWVTVYIHQDGSVQQIFQKTGALGEGVQVNGSTRISAT